MYIELYFGEIYLRYTYIISDGGEHHNSYCQKHATARLPYPNCLVFQPLLGLGDDSLLRRIVRVLHRKRQAVHRSAPHLFSRCLNCDFRILLRLFWRLAFRLDFRLVFRLAFCLAFCLAFRLAFRLGIRLGCLLCSCPMGDLKCLDCLYC